jgi:endonuclease/exonuclease/phosphatase family metal-dependent hydrolase
MKKLSLFDKFLFFTNSLLGVFTLFGYVIPFLNPSAFGLLSVMSLSMPLLLFSNAFFLTYWLLKLKKQLFVSLVVLGLGYNTLQTLFRFQEKKNFLNEDLKVMSYNVRLFNKSKWSKNDSLGEKTALLIRKKNPDVLGMQEYYPTNKVPLDFPYSYVEKNPNGRSLAKQALFSKHKMIDKGSLNFEKSGNNAIFADIVVKEDTLRIYNIHLESMSIDKNKDNFGQKDSEALLSRFKKSFAKQVVQVQKIVEHQKASPYKTIFLGDFNNTAFSWVYRQLSNGKKDAFVEAGVGLGKSFDYVFPFRIDFILTENCFEINNFKTFNVPYSDHYPIMARIQIPKIK